MAQAFQCVCVLSPQSCPVLCDPTDCSPPGSSAHGILQARILEWVASSSSRGSSWTRDWTHVSCISGIMGRFLTAEPPDKPIWMKPESWICNISASSHPVKDKLVSLSFSSPPEVTPVSFSIYSHSPSGEISPQPKTPFSNIHTFAQAVASAENALPFSISEKSTYSSSSAFPRGPPDGAVFEDRAAAPSLCPLRTQHCSGIKEMLHVFVKTHHREWSHWLKFFSGRKGAIPATLEGTPAWEKVLEKARDTLFLCFAHLPEVRRIGKVDLILVITNHPGVALVFL